MARRGKFGKAALLMGAAAVAAGVLLKRDKVAGLLPSRTGEPAPAAPVPPQPSNYDAPGPVANTATPIPAPDPHGEPPATIDETSEEAAAAAEAGAIGGTSTHYAGAEPGEPADEAYRPVAEGGGGEAEGQEQAEASLADNATYRDAGTSDAERRIEDSIEQADQPQQGETPAPLASQDPVPATAEPASEEAPGGGISGRPHAGLEHRDEAAEEQARDRPSEEETPAGPPTEQQPAEQQAREDEGSDDWRTWSGRSVNP
jgi:hypothetical protein